MVAHSLADPFDAMGEWFVPDRTNPPVAGRLSYGGHQTLQTTLCLNGPLVPIPVGAQVHLGVDDYRTYPVVHGVTNAGEAVSIIGASQGGLSIGISSGGARTPITLYCDIVLVGAHVTAETLYSEMLCRVPGLELWLGKRTVSGQIQQESIS